MHFIYVRVYSVLYDDKWWIAAISLKTNVFAFSHFLLLLKTIRVT